MSDAEVIRRVSTQFVPVAVNLYKVRNAKDAGGALFRSAQQQKDQYQGLWMLSPEGKVLAAHHQFKDAKSWPGEVITALDAALAAFGNVEPRRAVQTTPLPYRGVGAQPDGAVSLAVHTRYLHHEKADGPVVIDTLTLSDADWRQLIPPKLEAGASWRIPENVARKFSRVLSPSSDQSTMPVPSDVTSVEMVGTPGPAENGVVRVRYAGRLAAAHTYEGKTSRGEATLAGEALCDAVTGQPRALTFLFIGIHRSPPPYDAPRNTGAVVEWRAAP